jgi:CheY-like chemotaxis protein
MKPIELLVVDNNIRDIFLVRQALAEERYPLNIRVAPSSCRACQMMAAKQCEPDLAILDLSLTSSLTVLESIDPYVPVVVFTSLATPIDRRMALRLGFVDYIEKPTDPTQFVEAVSRLVKQWMPVPVG